MEWKGHRDASRVLIWLEQTAAEHHVKDRRLDPFATSMRDFDDVSPDLKNLRSGQPLTVSDPRQRITDLRGAGLIESNGTTLSLLGVSTLDAWEKYGVASADKEDELSRHVLLLREAQRLGDSKYAGFFNYWAEMREHFNPSELINNWDALYVLNYLDYRRSGFCPGDRYRAENIPVTDITFDLVKFAQSASGSEQAVMGAKSIERAIQGKIPRGRHRATFCGALEIILSDGSFTKYMIGHYGFPKKPRIWLPLSQAQGSKVEKIVSDNFAEQEETQADSQDLSLPENIDFSEVLVDVPELEGKHKPQATEKNKRDGKRAKKVDHINEAIQNETVGGLGEEFALAYEQWRLRDHPELLENIKHISKEDDSVGYDIESYEPNGTPRFLEVKSTLGNMENQFFVTENELKTAKEKGEQYVILRVSNLESNPKCCEIRFPFEGILDLAPSTYTATFRHSSLLADLSVVLDDDI